MRRVFWHPNRGWVLFLAPHACLTGIHGGPGGSVYVNWSTHDYVDRDPAYNLKTLGADEILYRSFALQTCARLTGFALTTALQAIDNAVRLASLATVPPRLLTSAG